jgi:hypothetical protein
VSELGCLSCRHSSFGERARLMCGRTGFAARQRCRDFDYEPGTDESERREEVEPQSVDRQG